MQRQKYKEKINSARKSRKSLEDILLMINFAAKFKYRIYETIERILCLVMFNRVAHQEYATSQNITSIMGKSRKKTPVCTWCCCKSQKRGKKISHRKFRRKEAIVIISGEYDLLPTRQWEIVEQWDLGGDGKHYCGHSPNEEWYIKLMRK